MGCMFWIWHLLVLHVMLRRVLNSEEIANKQVDETFIYVKRGLSTYGTSRTKNKT